MWLAMAVSEGRWEQQLLHSISTRSGAAGSQCGRRCSGPQTQEMGAQKGGFVAPHQLARKPDRSCCLPSAFRVLLQPVRRQWPLSRRLSLGLPLSVSAQLPRSQAAVPERRWQPSRSPPVA